MHVISTEFTNASKVGYRLMLKFRQRFSARQFAQTKMGELLVRDQPNKLCRRLGTFNFVEKLIGITETVR